MKPMKKQAAIHQDPGMQVRDAVVTLFLKTGKPVRAPELAQEVGWSLTKVYHVLQNNYGAPTGVTAHQISRSHGHEYLPDVFTLRHAILTAGTICNSCKKPVSADQAHWRDGGCVGNCCL